MNEERRSNKSRWLLTIMAIALIAGGYYLWNYTGLLTQLPAVSAQGAATPSSATGAAAAEDAPALVAIQPADLVISQVSASGNISLIDERPVVAETGGTVATVDVSVGDVVRAGDRLLLLDVTDLERAARRAELAVAAAQNDLEDVLAAATASELAVAEANLLEAQENLADVLSGPSDAEIAAARSSLAAAQSTYSELVAGPSQDELTQLSASMKKAEIAVAEAQSAYNQIAWKNDAGTSSEAATLQSATIELESARAAYAESSAAAAASDLQSTVSSIKSAQVTLDDLLASPTAAEIASAEAQVADAQATLDDLRAGPDATNQRSAEIALEQALIDLEEAYATLQAATVAAPISGTVMAVAVAAGDKVSSGATVVTLADPSQLELTISVAELDIPRVALGQQAEVAIDALAGQNFAGEVAQIAPASDASASSVSYPVTIRLTAAELAGVRPGMSAVGTLLDESVTTDASWLVPTNAIRTQGGAAVVRVMRDGGPIPVTVTTGAVQGEWTVVQSPDLQTGDQVVGSVTSYVTEATNELRFGAGLGGPPPGGGMPMGAP
jgi:HlyD family secretion protein